MNQPALKSIYKQYSIQEKNKIQQRIELHLANTSVGNNLGRNIRHSIMAHQALLVGSRLGHDIRIGTVLPGTGSRQAVPLADISELIQTGASRFHCGGGVQLAASLERCLGHRCFDVLKVVALEQHPGVGVDVKGMPADILEVVVHAVEEDLRLGVVGSHVRGAARDIVQPVAFEGVVVLLAEEEKSPVVLAVAAGGPGGAAVEFVVGDGDVAGFAPAADDELAADERDLPVSCQSNPLPEAVRRTLLWSIQTLSALSRVMASPPQTYWGLRFCLISFVQVGVKGYRYTP